MMERRTTYLNRAFGLVSSFYVKYPLLCDALCAFMLLRLSFPWCVAQSPNGVKGHAVVFFRKIAWDDF